MYIRLAKGGDPVVSRDDLGFKIGKAILIREGQDALFVSTGVTTRRALEAASRLREEGVSVGVLHMHTLKPFDEETFFEAAKTAKAVVTIEEHVKTGGLGSAVAEVFAENNLGSNKRFKRISLPDKFIHEYGSQDFLLEKYGVTADKAAEAIRHLLP